MPQPLARIIEQLKREPSRTGSIVITVFGDAIVPRGGSVWLGTLLEFFKTLDIDSGVVRTAMSRLAADGWLERNKVGRNSFYRLAEKGGKPSMPRPNTSTIRKPSDWTGRFELLLIGNGEDRDAAREALKNAGFGSPLPGVWVAPSGVPIPEEAAAAIRLEVSAEDDSGRRLLSESWPLDRTADAYLKFMKTFEPLRGWIGRRDALVGHRRLHRADPADPLITGAWCCAIRCCRPRFAARRTGRAGPPGSSAARSIAALLPASERWLDRNGSTRAARLPQPARNSARGSARL